MKILVAHNAYQWRGGEDMVVEAEIALLREAGHAVLEYRCGHAGLQAMGPLELAGRSLWNPATWRALGRLIDAERPDVVHVHNTLPLLSPSLYDVCAARRTPLVQTLHNFRLGCPNGLLMRDGQPCEDCLGRMPLPALVHGCYRGSRAQTAVLVAGVALHRTRGTVRRAVHRYIVLSEFARSRFEAMGLPPERLVQKPQFVPAPAPSLAPREGLLYVGRLSQEKGVEVLAQALQAAPQVVVRIAGHGPLQGLLQACPNARLLGTLSPAQVLAAMAASSAVLLPSVCYEGAPRAVVEAYATGTPVIASDIGSLPEAVVHGRTGWLVTPGDPQAWAEALRRADAQPRLMAAMGQHARAAYDTRHTPERNLAWLLDIYRQAQHEAATP